MPPGPSSWSTFRDLDSSRELDESVTWLAAVAGLAPVREGKQRSYELLGVAAGDRVLDVGCGVGSDVLSLSRLVLPGGEAVGVDSSPAVIEAACRSAPATGGQARFFVADATELPFTDDAFDACRCDRTLQHLPDPQAALREMVRVTRPGGVVLISEGLNTVKLGEGLELTALHELLAEFHAREERAGWVGFMLPLLLRQAGLEALEHDRLAGELRSAQEIATFYDLPRLARRAISEARFTEAQYEALVERLVTETCAGRLRVEVETFLFSARVSG
jgi:ubiquinone/menaquinone biosynthesis C-methylase UbiE